MRITKRSLLLLLATIAIIIGTLAAGRMMQERSKPPRRSPLVIDRAKREIRIAATVHAGHLSRRWVQPGHHSVVWKNGRARRGALFLSEASDEDVRTALIALGAKPGENLTEATWNARGDPHNSEPDKRVEGTPVDVLVEWAGSGKAIPLGDLIAENGRPAQFDFRFGGNERFRKDFQSGCIVCNYSCPGGAIGNRNRTIREEEKLGPIFTAVSSRLPPDGSDVTVILKLRAQ